MAWFVAAVCCAQSAPVQSGSQQTETHRPRVFDSSDAAPAVQMVDGKNAAVETVSTAKRKSSYEVKVGTTDWVDTGIPLNAGDTLRETATGTLTFANGKTADAGGAEAGWRDLLRQYPLPNAPVGALIGRVGNNEASVPFLLGTNGSATVGTGGNLFLRANLSGDMTASGEYKVKIMFAKEAKAAVPVVAATGSAGDAAGTFRAEISPALFTNIPRRVQDQHGAPGDMVNFALIGTQEQMTHAFTAAGWVPVDKTVEDAILHGLQSTMQHKAYLEMPMSTLFLFGRAQDFSFARAAPLEVAAIRHHLRVWDSGQKVDGRTLWVGSATHDNGFEKDERNGNVTHHIDPEIDQERDFLLASFQQAGATSATGYVLPANPVQSARTATGGEFKTDGRIAVMELK
jgi:hypothetical protein